MDMKVKEQERVMVRTEKIKHLQKLKQVCLERM